MLGCCESGGDSDRIRRGGYYRYTYSIVAVFKPGIHEVIFMICHFGTVKNVVFLRNSWVLISLQTINISSLRDLL